MRRLALALILGSVLSLCAPRVLAQHESHQGPPAPSVPASEPTPAPWLKPGVLAASIALVPGFVLHGAGSFSIGQRKTAKRLVLAEAVGLGAFIGAGALIAQTGTARRMVGALTPLVIGGFGVFALSWLADIYAAATGGRDAYGPRFVPQVEVQLGYLYVHDPQFSCSRA